MRCLKFCSIENFKSINFLLKIPKKILKINFYANLSASSSEYFFPYWVNFTPIFRQGGGLIFTNNCLFHFSPLRIYKLKQFQNELIFNEASCLRFSSNMTVLQLPFRFSCCWSNRFQKMLVGKASFLSLWINILFKRFKKD